MVKGLWESWDDDALIRDRASGIYFDPAKLHALNHKGQHFSVRGPLNVARPPQGHPVLFQAGSSDVGREVAARFAEGVFTPQHTLAGAQEFYRDLKGRMARYGRPPEALKIMPGLNAVVGRTRREAEEKHRFLQSKIHPDVGLELLSNQLDNSDLSEFDLDGPLPEIPDHVAALAGQTSMRNIVRWSREEGLTIRQIYERFAGARGQRTLIGSPAEIADDMETWFRGHGSTAFSSTRPTCRAASTTSSISSSRSAVARPVPRRMRGRDLAREHGIGATAQSLRRRVAREGAQNARRLSRNCLCS